MIVPAVQPMIDRFARYKEEDDSEMRLFKSKKASLYFFKSCWHIFSTLGLLNCVMNKAWMPTYMGGKGSFIAGFTDMPFTPMDRDGYYFGLIILGYPLYETGLHFTKKDRTPDFAEMSLHHVTHLALASCYLFTNMIPVGSLVALLHVSCDIPCALAKVFHITNVTVPTIFFLITTQVFWFYNRIICLPTIIYEIYGGL